MRLPAFYFIIIKLPKSRVILCWPGSDFYITLLHVRDCLLRIVHGPTEMVSNDKRRKPQATTLWKPGPWADAKRLVGLLPKASIPEVLLETGPGSYTPMSEATYRKSLQTQLVCKWATLQKHERPLKRYLQKVCFAMVSERKVTLDWGSDYKETIETGTWSNTKAL